MACFPGASKGVIVWGWVNSPPKDKLLDSSKFKAFADDKLNAAIMMTSLFDGEENTVEKGENTGYQYFLLFPQSFPKPFSLGSFKRRTVW